MKFNIQKNYLILGMLILIILLFSFVFVEKPSTYSIIYGGDEGIIERIDDPANLSMAVVTQQYNCSPSSSYTACVWTKKYDDASLTASQLGAKIETYSSVGMPPYYAPDVTRYYAGAKSSLPAGYSTGSNKLYYTDKCFNDWSSFWGFASCNVNGCSGLTQVLNSNEKTLIDGYGKNYVGCPTFVSLTTYSLGSGGVTFVGTGYYGLGMGKTYLANTISIGECTTGQTKCVGQDSFVCQNSLWVNQGKVDGLCGFVGDECSSGEQECLGTTLKYCSSGVWAYEVDSSQCSVGECSGDEQECIGTTLKRCVDNYWIYNSNDASCISINCVSGEKKCDGFILSVCENNVWVVGGEIAGFCGVEPPAFWEDVYLMGGLIVVLIFVSGGVVLFLYLKKRKRR